MPKRGVSVEMLSLGEVTLLHKLPTKPYISQGVQTRLLEASEGGADSCYVGYTINGEFADA